MKSRIYKWLLSKCLHQRKFKKAYVFGSFVYTGRLYRDVDILLVVSAWNVAKEIEYLRTTFRHIFQMRLHIQKYHTSQVLQLHAFLKNAYPVREIV